MGKKLEDLNNDEFLSNLNNLKKMSQETDKDENGEPEDLVDMMERTKTAFVRGYSDTNQDDSSPDEVLREHTEYN